MVEEDMAREDVRVQVAMLGATVFTAPASGRSISLSATHVGRFGRIFSFRVIVFSSRRWFSA